MQPQPLIGTHDVPATSRWYQAVLGFTTGHGGHEYEKLLSGETVLQLHAWDLHEPSSLGRPEDEPAGNGVVLWSRDPEVTKAYARAQG